MFAPAYMGQKSWAKPFKRSGLRAGASFPSFVEKSNNLCNLVEFVYRATTVTATGMLWGGMQAFESHAW